MSLTLPIIFFLQHIVFEDDLSTDNNSEFGSGDIGANFEVPCDVEVSHEFQRIFLPTVYGIIIVLGLVGNGLVVLVMGCQKKSRTMTDKYRLHLSVADLLFVLTLPFWAVDAAKDWYFGGFMCVAVHMIYTVNLYSSVLILAFISLDRYLAVVRATNSQGLRKLLANRIIYVGVWLPAALLTVPDLGVRQSGEQLYPYFLRAHLPTGFFHNLGGRFPLPAHPSGLRAARARDSHLLLHHHLQTITRLQGHAEAQGAQDHRGSDRVLLRLLVAVLRRDPAGHADAAGGDSPQLRARAGSTEVDLRDGGSRVLSLLPQPNPLRVSGGEVQEVRSQRSISQPGAPVWRFCRRREQGCHPYPQNPSLLAFTLVNTSALILTVNMLPNMILMTWNDQLYVLCIGRMQAEPEWKVTRM